MKIPTTLDRKNNKLRFFTFALAVWLLIAAMPISAFAELLELETKPMGDQTVYVLAEDTTKRSEFEKHYYCSDGTFVAVTYPEAVHYKDENGEWVDVDMRLASDASTASYESQSGDFKTVFTTPGASGDVSVMANGTTAATPAISMQSGDHSLSWSLSGTKFAAPAGTSTYSLNPNAGFETVTLSASDDAQIQVLGEMKTAETALSVQKIPVTDPDAFELPAASNQVMYEDVFGTEQNVSVRYSVSLNKIEEDILITAPTEMTSFSMQIACGELMPVLNLDNSVDFVDELGNMVYHVSIPYLADAAFAVSYDVSVTLMQQDGVCTITYTPDAEWMNAPEREYPIMLDPAVTTKEYTNAFYDTYFVEGENTGHYAEQLLNISQFDGKGRVAIFNFYSLPNIDASMPIISANFTLSTYIGPDSIELKLESLEEDVNFLTNDYEDWQVSNKEEIDRVAYSSGTAFFEFDMTDCIMDLYSGNIGRFFSVSLYDEESTAYVSPIHSVDTTWGASYRPCLTITYGYSLPAGLTAGDEITIQNYGSQGYLYPNSGLIGNGNSVLHVPNTTTSDTYRLLTLRQNPANGTYRLEYTPSSNSTGAYISADTTTNNVVMYNTTNVPSNIKQDWLIVPDSINTFKIVLASDMSYVLTAVGDAGTGYVSIDMVPQRPIGNQNNQSWLIYEDGKQIQGLAMTSPPLSTGVYYINNKETGKFVSYNDSYEALGSIGGKIADIGDMIAWKITKLPDGYYTIQNANNSDEFLSVQMGSVVTGTCGETIPSIYKWRIEETSEYYYIKNVGAKKYLYLDTDESTPQIYGVQAGNSDSVCKWRVVNKNEYIEYSGGVVLEKLLLGVSYDQQFVINTIGAGTWTNTQDFSFLVTQGNSCTVTASGLITAQEEGVSTLKITHRVTGQTDYCYVIVQGVAVTYECEMGEVFCLTSIENYDHPAFDGAIWQSSNETIATINELGQIVAHNSGYAFVFALDDNYNILSCIEIKVVDPLTEKLKQLTANEIEYLYCPSSFLNLWARDLPNAFEYKLEIIYTLRKYYMLPDAQQPSPDEIKTILQNELGMSVEDEMVAASLFHECFMGYRGLYNEEYLNDLRTQYFNQIKGFVSFCAFSMAANLDPVNTLSNCEGISDFKEDLATEWTNNKSSHNFMLGTNHNGVYYVDRAQKLGYGYFYSNEYNYIKNQYGTNYVKEVNQIVLDRVLTSGKTIYFSHNPLEAPSYTMLHMEYEYIVDYYASMGKSVSIMEKHQMIDGIACLIWKLTVN